MGTPAVDEQAAEEAQEDQSPVSLMALFPHAVPVREEYFGLVNELLPLPARKLKESRHPATLSSSTEPPSAE